MTIAAFEGHHIAANFSWKMGVKCALLNCTNKKKRHFMYLQGSLSLKASCLMLNSVSWIKEDLSSDKAACSSSCEANSFSSSSPSSLVRILCFNFSLNPLRNSLLRETDNALTYLQTPLQVKKIKKYRSWDTQSSNVSATPIGQMGIEMGWFPLCNGVCLIMQKAPSDRPIWQLKKRELLLPLSSLTTKPIKLD